MTNSEKFKDVFGLYATELWAMPQEDFLNWINTEYKEFESVQLDLISKQETIDILKAIKHGLWEIDIPSPGNVPEYVEHHKQIKDMMEVVDVWIKKVVELPSVQPEQVIPHKKYKGNFLTYWCECGCYLGKKGEKNYCPDCGGKVNWNGRTD